MQRMRTAPWRRSITRLFPANSRYFDKAARIFAIRAALRISNILTRMIYPETDTDMVAMNPM